MRYLFALLLFLIVPAHAVEQVAPTNASTLYYIQNNGAGPYFSSVAAACAGGTPIWGGATTQGVYSTANPTAANQLAGTCTNWWGIYIRAPQCPTATPAYTFNWTTNMCERPNVCPANGTVKNSGWFDAGTVPKANGMTVPPLNTCDSAGCTLAYNGGNASRTAIIAGITHYYAQGSYVYDGTTCTLTASNGALANLGAVPGSTCAAGQSFVSMNGVDKCLNSATGTVADTRSASAVAAATTAASDAAAAKTLADAQALAAAIQAAKNAAAAAGGDASAVQAAATQAAANYAAQQQSPQAQNPTDPCANSQTVGCMQSGELPTAEAIGTKNIDFGTFAFNTYSFTGNAACPAPRSFSVMGKALTYSYQPFCTFLDAFKWVALAVAMFVAGMIMIGQRSADSGG